jgi:hypothetical protein
VTVSNTGNAALVLGAIGLGGAQAANFSQATGGTCASGASLAAGASCTVKIAFAPAVSGTAAASLSIAHNAVGSPSTVTLNGTGTPAPQPLIALNKNALTFASQAVGSTSAALSLTVSNPGQAALVLSSLTLSGPNASDFAFTGIGNCSAGASIAVGASCTVQLSFAPSAAVALGARSASLGIASNASGAAPVVAVAGTAIAAPAPAVTLAPATPQDFGAVTLGAAPAVRTVVLSNSGTAALTPLSVAVSGAGFSVANGCAGTLAAGASCTLTLRFAPQSTGAASGLLTVTSNAAGSPRSLALSGSGDPVPLPVLAWTAGAPSHAFVDTYVGAPSTAVAYTMVNQGPGAVTINSIGFTGANAADFLVDSACASAGSVLAVNQSCDISLRFAPADMGPRSARLNVVSSGTNPVAVELAGNGVSLAGAALSLSSQALSVPAYGGAAAPLTLTNSGTAAVTISELRFAGNTFRVRLDACGSLPLVLQPNGSCQIDVVVEAGAAAGATDTLTVTTTPDTVSKRLSVSTEAVVNNVGAGGCSLADPNAAGFDPLLLALAALSLLVLWSRRSRG